MHRYREEAPAVSAALAGEREKKSNHPRVFNKLRILKDRDKKRKKHALFVIAVKVQSGGREEEKKKQGGGNIPKIKYTHSGHTLLYEKNVAARRHPF